MSGHSSSGSLVVPVVSIVLAILAGWYAVALGWTAIFLLDESLPMAVFAAAIYAAPVLYTLVALTAWRGKNSVALWLLSPFVLKWVAMSIWSWTEGGVGEFVARLPGVSLVTMLNEGFADTYPLDQFILLIAQFQVEPVATIVLAGLLIARVRTARRSGSGD